MKHGPSHSAVKAGSKFHGALVALEMFLLEHGTLAGLIAATKQGVGDRLGDELKKLVAQYETTREAYHQAKTALHSK